MVLGVKPVFGTKVTRGRMTFYWGTVTLGCDNRSYSTYFYDNPWINLTNDAGTGWASSTDMLDRILYRTMRIHSYK